MCCDPLLTVHPQRFNQSGKRLGFIRLANCQRVVAKVKSRPPSAQVPPICAGEEHVVSGKKDEKGAQGRCQTQQCRPGRQRGQCQGHRVSHEPTSQSACSGFLCPMNVYCNMSSMLVYLTITWVSNSHFAFGLQTWAYTSRHALAFGLRILTWSYLHFTSCALHLVYEY